MHQEHENIPVDPKDEFQDWSVPDLVLDAVRIIRCDARGASENACVSMDNPFEHEVESLRDAAYWDGYTAAVECILKPFLPVDESWEDGDPSGPQEDAIGMLAAAKLKCSDSTDRLRIEIALLLMGVKS